jgi:hypothetical protein
MKRNKPRSTKSLRKSAAAPPPNTQAASLTPAAPAEGKGRFRAELRLLTRAIREGWDVDPVFKRAAIQRTAQVLADPTANRRDVARATNTLMAIDRLALEAAVEGDRMERLEAGEATDRVQVISDLTDAQMAALAKTITNAKR